MAGTMLQLIGGDADAVVVNDAADPAVRGGQRDGDAVSLAVSGGVVDGLASNSEYGFGGFSRGSSVGGVDNDEMAAFVERPKRFAQR